MELYSGSEPYTFNTLSYYLSRSTTDISATKWQGAVLPWSHSFMSLWGEDEEGAAPLCLFLKEEVEEYASLLLLNCRIRQFYVAPPTLHL